MTRLRYVLDLINKLLSEYNPIVRVIEHYAMNKGDVEYFNVRINISYANAVVEIRE